MKKIDLALGVSYFVLITISLASTTFLSREIIEVIRYVSMFSVLACLVCFLSNRINSNFHLIAVVLCFVLYFIGALGSYREFVDPDWYKICFGFLITILGISTLSVLPRPVFSPRFAEVVLVYALFVVVFTVLTGGFVFSFPPSFNLEYASDFNNGNISYSQGLSKFYGMVAISTAFYACSDVGKIRQIFAFLLVVLFLVMSALGGGRGDSIAAIFFVVVYLLYRKPSSLFFIVPFVAFVYFFVAESLTSELTIVGRLEALSGGDLGYRDILFYQAIDLIFDNSVCMFFGCGFEFFQKYYGYESGMYPHNVLVEFVVVYGFPLFFVFFAFVAKGVLAYFRVIGLDLFLILFFYVFTVSMKSGDIVGSWLMMASCIYFFVHGVGRINVRTH